MWRETTKHERNRRIFEEEFAAYLPPKILDFHVHIWNEGVMPYDKPAAVGGPLITHYDFNNLSQDLDEVYPGRETLAVCFGWPSVDGDLTSNNEYIASGCDNRRYFGLRLFDPLHCAVEDIAADLRNGRFLGIKPYPVYVRKANEADVEIDEMLPPWVMEVVDDAAALVMLHIPRKARLADSVNQSQLRRLCTTYPNVKIVLAHVGRAYFYKNVIGNLDRLVDLPNLYYDLTMLNNWEVLEYTFRKVAPDKILYGTDIPIALAPGKSVEINDQYTYVTPEPWNLSISDDHRKLVFTSFLYEELRAIKKATDRLGLGVDFVEGLFYRNGMRLLESVLTGRPRATSR
jgi:hypothetical protein